MFTPDSIRREGRLAFPFWLSYTDVCMPYAVLATGKRLLATLTATLTTCACACPQPASNTTSAKMKAVARKNFSNFDICHVGHFIIYFLPHEYPTLPCLRRGRWRAQNLRFVW